VSQPADHSTENEDGPASGDVRTARNLVAGQFVLIGILVLLPGRHDLPVAAALKVACSIGTVVGLAVIVIGATGLGRGLTATPLPNGHAQRRTGGLYRYARHPIYSGLLLAMASITVAAHRARFAVDLLPTPWPRWSPASWARSRTELSVFRASQPSLQAQRRSEGGVSLCRGQAAGGD